VDGTVTTQPEFSFFFDDVGWRVENYGTDPDIEVDNAPHDYARGADPQLDKAIEVALDLLAKRPPHRPRPTDRPSRIPPRLAPRTTAHGSELADAGRREREPAGARSIEGAANSG
jgi:tricorn protease